MEKPEIKFDEWCTGPQGMRFELYPIKDLHTDIDVNAVKAQLYRDRDVVQLKVTWLRDLKAVAKWAEDSPVPKYIITDTGQIFWPNSIGIYGIYGDETRPTNTSTIGWSLEAARSVGFKLVY